MLSRNVVKIISTKDIESLWVGFLKGRKELCMYRHTSGPGPGACLILLIHGRCRLPRGGGHPGNITWVLDFPGEVYVYTLFCSISSFSFVYFTNLSLESSFLKDWIKPWVFMALHLEQLRAGWRLRGDGEGGWRTGVCSPTGTKAAILASVVSFTVRAERVQSEHQCRLILANLWKSLKERRLWEEAGRACQRE